MYHYSRVLTLWIIQLCPHMKDLRLFDDNFSRAMYIQVSDPRKFRYIKKAIGVLFKIYGTIMNIYC